jgi:hypothetical protein
LPQRVHAAELRHPPLRYRERERFEPPRVSRGLEHCPKRGGELEVIAAILETQVIERILEPLGLPVRAPPRSPARAPTSHAA